MTYPQRRQQPHRPYAHPKNRKRIALPSVTTVLGVIGSAGDALTWAAVRETVDYTLDFRDQWETLDRDAAFNKLYRHHRGLWDGRAEIGTIVHEVNEAWTYGKAVDPYDLIVDAANRDKRPVRQWQGRESYIADEVAGFVDALERFWRDKRPKTVGTEEVVRHNDRSHGYIGQRDWTAEVDGLPGVTLIDLKTSAKLDDGTDPYVGLYFDKFRLQLAAYRNPKCELVYFDDECNEVEAVPGYAVSQACILGLRSDGSYVFPEIRAGGDELAHFYRAVDLWRWTTKGFKEPAPVERGLLLAMRDEENAA